MGYRNYIATISKIEYERIKNFTKEELYKDRCEDIIEGYVSVSDIPEKVIYELGKYVDEFEDSFFQPVFLNEHLQKDMNEGHDFYLVGKEFVKAIIDRYKEKVVENYNNMCTPFFDEKSEFFKSAELACEYNENEGTFKESYTFDFSTITQEEQTALHLVLEFIKDMRQEWIKVPPYQLRHGDSIAEGCKYEYQIFELVRIYKHFDWENNYMIYYGF